MHECQLNFLDNNKYVLLIIYILKSNYNEHKFASLICDEKCNGQISLPY